MLDFAAQAASRLEELTAARERRDTLDADIAAAERAMLDLGHKLTTKRTASAKKLGDKVKAGLKDLGFAKAEFSIALEKLADPGPHGCEQAEFQFSPNPGEPARPLRAIASSGENFSRDARAQGCTGRPGRRAGAGL